MELELYIKDLTSFTPVISSDWFFLVPRVVGFKVTKKSGMIELIHRLYKNFIERIQSEKMTPLVMLLT
jgi:hypothetical protein